MNIPTPDLPQLPNLKDKLDQISEMVAQLRLDLTGTRLDPVDDTQFPPWRNPINKDEIAQIVDALTKLKDPFIRRSGIGIEGIEMTQSVQFYDLYGQGSGDDSNNAVPLVAGKDLILRVYVEEDDVCPAKFRRYRRLPVRGDHSGSCCSKFSHPSRRTSGDPTQLSVARHAVRSRQPGDHERQSRAVRSNRGDDRVVPLPRPQSVSGSGRSIPRLSRSNPLERRSC